MKLKPHERLQRKEVIAKLKAAGASVSNGHNMLVVRYNGMTWECFPRRGTYRRRIYGIHRCVLNSGGLEALLAEMSSQNPPEFARRSYQTEGRIPIAAQG